MRLQILKQQPASPNKPPTPLEKLLADKNELEVKCNIREKQLYADFEFIRDNAHSIFLSGLSSLLFAYGRAKKKSIKQSLALANDNQSLQNNRPYSPSSWLSVVNAFTPMLWDFVKPLIINWGVNKAKNYLIALFSAKKGNGIAKIKR